MARSSSSPDVVYHLTWAYSLNNVSSPHFHRLGKECSGESQYLYMPLANGWDCYKHETFDRIDGWQTAADAPATSRGVLSGTRPGRP